MRIETFSQEQTTPGSLTSLSILHRFLYSTTGSISQRAIIAALCRRHLGTVLPFISSGTRQKFASKLGNTGDPERATFAMQFAVRTMVCVIRQGALGLPLNLDTLAFWAYHMVFVTAIMHIKFGARNEN